MIATSIVTWTGYYDTYHYESSPYSPARRGLNVQASFSAPVVTFICGIRLMRPVHTKCKMKRSPNESFHSWPLRGLFAANSIEGLRHEAPRDWHNGIYTEQMNNYDTIRYCTDLETKPRAFWDE